GSAAAYEDPTNIARQDGYQYAPEAAGSGIGNVFQNAKWAVKGNARYQAPWQINLAVNYLGRQGFPFPQAILSPARANGAGTANVLLDPLGEVRLDSTQTFDFRVDKTIHFGSASIVPSIDIFNLSNANTVQAINRFQAATNANTVSGIIAPRVMRFGVALHW